MDNAKNGSRSWTEYFRVITPFLLIVLTAIGGSINTRLASIEDKLFKHLTNDEVHTPKSIVITKAEFDIYRDFRTKELNDVKDAVCDLNKNYAINREIIRENTKKMDELIQAVKSRPR